MYIIGANTSHDQNVCLLEDGKVIAAIACERITRSKRVPPKREGGVFARAGQYCCEIAGISLDDIDYFICCSTEEEDQDHALRSSLQTFGFVDPRRVLIMPSPGHHLAHAYGAFEVATLNRTHNLRYLKQN